MCRCLLWMVAVAMVVQTGRSATDQRPLKATETGGRAVVPPSKDATVAKRNTPKETIAERTMHGEEERLGRKMFRICYLEKRLNRVFARRLTNQTSNTLRYYDLPAPVRIDPLLREAYLVHRCPHHKPASSATPSNVRLPSNKTKIVTKSGHQKRRHNKQSCTGIKVYVSFSDLGWSDWIVQPKGFVTTVCIGTCQSHDISAYLLLNPKSNCCSPSRYKSLQVLQYNSSGSLNVTVLPDLIAVRCRCRRC